MGGKKEDIDCDRFRARERVFLFDVHEIMKSSLFFWSCIVSVILSNYIRY